MRILLMPGWIEALIWLVIACFFAVAEAFTPSFFLIFFSLGAIVAAVFALFTGEIVQIIAFLLSSILAIIFARPVIKKYIEKDKDPTPSNVFTLIGTKAVVIKPVDQINGKVKIMNTGEVWSAYTFEHFEPIEESTQVIIKEVDGAKLVVIPKSASEAEVQKRS